MSFALYISCFLFLALLSEQAPLFERSISPAPAIAANFPDPTIIQVNGVWYAFSTNSNRRNIPVATSPDFINWSVTGADALPILGAWTVSGGGGVWAPSVTQLVGVLDTKGCSVLTLAPKFSPMATSSCIIALDLIMTQITTVSERQNLPMSKAHIPHSQNLLYVIMRK